MTNGQSSEVIQQLRSAVLLRDGAELTDGQLLEGFLNRRDEAALAALVLRHAPMVWGVCRRILRNEHDAEDAFQATFLVFARRAASIASRELLANWLYGVAFQTARKARATIARKSARERQVPDMPEPEAPQPPRDDLRSLLDEELSHLPNKYRAPLVLCDLEGKTRQEAARELDCPEGTVAGRLARAREMLAKRLARHGAVLSTALIAEILSQEAAAAVPSALVSSVIRAASPFAAGRAAAPGAISPTVAALTEGVLKSMVLTRLKTAVAVVAAVVVLGAGLATAGLLYRAEPPKKSSDKSEVKEKSEAKDPREVKDAKKALNTLQGEWQVSKLDIDHDETRQEFEKLGRFVVKGDRATLLLDLVGLGEEKTTVTGGEFTILKLDPTRSPPTIDLRLDDSVAIDGLEPKEGVVILGIYSLEGDTLKLFFGAEARPESFPKEEKQGVVTLKRLAAPKGKDDKPTEKPAPKKEGGAPKVGPRGFAVLDPTMKNGQVEFELASGRNVDGIVKFIVEDAEGKELWVVAGSGQNGIHKITYGVVPDDPNYAGQQQQYPRGNKAPEDIRGNSVRIRVHYRFRTLFGPGVEIYSTKLEVPKEELPGGDEAKPVPLSKTWIGEVGLDVIKAAPKSDYVADKEAWAKLWKAFRGNEKVPDVDFDKELVLVAVNHDPNNILLGAALDKKGNLKVTRGSTLILFTNPTTGKYMFATIKRAGIKTIDGNPIGKDKK